MNKKSGSIILWITIAVMLGCFLLIVYSLFATHQKTAVDQSPPPIYRQSSLESQSSSEPSLNDVEPSDHSEKKIPIHEATEEGLN